MWKTISNESGKAAGPAPVAGNKMRHPGVFLLRGSSMTPIANKSTLQCREISLSSHANSGSIERMLWLRDQDHCNHFSMAAEIRGHTTVTMWRNALDQLQRRHPLLNVFIGMDQNSRPVFYQAAHASPALAG